MLSLCLFVSALTLSCGSTPTDLRSFVPADTLIYLDTNDLGAVMRQIVSNPEFQKAAAGRPDFSALEGVQLAVAISGFEMSEEKLTDEHSIARVQPRFVAIADTHAWGWQTKSLAENNIGAFVMEAYRSDISQERSEKHGGSWFAWTAQDGRKAFALVIGSIVMFGNDEATLEKCLAVRRGEGDSISRIGKVPPLTPKIAAVGYVAPDGIAQIANLAGIGIATRTEGEPEVQSAIAGLLPQVVRNMISEISWTSSLTDSGFEDRYSLTTPPSVTTVFSETMQPGAPPNADLFKLVPSDIPSLTVYSLQRPNVAWRSLLLTAQSVSGPSVGPLIAEFAGVAAMPYGIRDMELFLGSVAQNILVGNVDPAGDRPVVIAQANNFGNVKKSLYQDLTPDPASSGEFGVEFFRSADGELSAAFFDSNVVVGSSEGVAAVLRRRQGDKSIAASAALVQLLSSGATAATLAIDSETASSVASVLSEKKPGTVTSAYTVETRFTRNGIERLTKSDLGLVGWIVAQLDPE